MAKVEYNRREFLKMSAALTGALVFSPKELLPKLDTQLTFDEVVDFVVQLNSLYEKLPDYRIPLTQGRLQSWVDKVVALFQVCDFTDKAIHPTTAQLTDMRTQMMDGDKYLAGATDCDFSQTQYIDGMVIGEPTKNIQINENVNNPTSSWYQSKSALAWVIHELAHVQENKICMPHTLEKAKYNVAAQMATIEVLAYLALNETDPIAIFSLINLLMHMSMEAAEYLALKDSQYLPAFQKLEQLIFHTPYDQAWLAQREPPQDWLLEQYSYDPLNTLLQAHRFTNDSVTDLPFPHSTVKMKNFGTFISGNTAEQLLAKRLSLKND